MPYIKQDNRPRFQEHINNVVVTIMRNNSPVFVRAEYFGFFVDRLVNKYMLATDSLNPFNSSNFAPTVRKTLEDFASRIVSQLNRDDMIGSAGDLNFAISSVWWGILGCHAEVNEANYGFRAVTRGMIEQILASLNNIRFAGSDTLSTVINVRRAITVRGVLNDVISECYRRMTTVYENDKLKSNGDLWPVKEQT